MLKRLYHSSRRWLARRWIPAGWGITQIAVTGSQGKTSVSQMLGLLLATHAPTVVTDTNLDTIYNVPITTLRVRARHKYLIYELGIDRPGEMDYHLQIARPDIAVVTGISPVHTDEAHLGSLERLVSEKTKLPQALSREGICILNYSDIIVREMQSATVGSVVWYGSMEDYYPQMTRPYYGYSDISVDLKGTHFTLHDTARGQRLAISTGLYGEFHAQTITAIYAVMSHLDPSYLDDFATQVATHLKPLLGRMSMRSGPMETVILDDSLRANPTSTRGGLSTFARIAYPEGRKVAILADMGELADPVGEHRGLGEYLSHLPIDVVVCLGTMQSHTARALASSGKQVHHYTTVSEGKQHILEIIRPHDFIYLKGSLYSRVGKVFG